MTRSPRQLIHGLLRFGKTMLWLFVGLSIAFITCEVLGWKFLREPAQTLLSKQLQREVILDAPFQLHLWAGIQLDLGHLYISAPESFKAPHLVDANNISIKLRYSDLWRYKQQGALHIREIRVDDIDAQLIRHADGSATWQFPKEEDDDAASQPLPVIETLVVKNGSSTIKDAISNTSLKAKFKTDEGSLQDELRSEVSINGHFQDKPLKAFLETPGFLPIATQDQDAEPIKSKGWLEYAKLRVDFNGKVSDLFGRQDIAGDVVVTGPSLAVLGDLTGSVFPTTAPFRLSTTINKHSDIWEVNVDSAKIGKSSLNAILKYDPRRQDGGIPILSGQLGGSRFYLADLAPAFGALQADGSPVQPAKGRVIPDRPLDLPSLNFMDADISIKLDYMDLGNAFALPVSPFKAHLNLTQGKLGIDDIFANTADGSLNGSFSVDAHEDKDSDQHQYLPQWQIKLGWKNIDLAKWLQVSKDRQEAAKKQGKQAPPYITGTLNGRTDLTGKGNSTAGLLSSLNGKTTLFIEHGEVSRLIMELLGLDIAQSISAWLGGDHSQRLQCAVMDLKASNGLIQPEVALIDTPVTLVLINGSVDLGQEKLDLLLAAKPKNFSPLTLRSPIKLQGTFADPKVRPETVPIAARLLGSVALAFVNPLAAILPYLDTGSSSQAYNCSQSLSTYTGKPVKTPETPKASPASEENHAIIPGH
ncbi:AsmA protein/hypothetical protein [Methylobacillus rhizosphaerae]|uniref:AsmA domain-containing protein n=1 Tax=Methylobacillus rhizosphaerae TaxID=551994 RepID=A0A239ATW4_9PROT|nr:AsmA family protein [Methylobacillus rhizosphaerae]SNR99000.1 AsmA protein/hypothetical protein [Methylobacillus rhizosphaerae]